MHIPVLMNPILEHLKTIKPQFIVDGTIGYGGHCESFLNLFQDLKLLIGLDRDLKAIEFCREKFKGDSRVQLFHNSFSQLELPLLNFSDTLPDVMFFDFGVSSPQLDVAERGFSFRQDGPLDMRMDPDSGGLKALDVINRSSEGELRTIFSKFGEEPQSSKISRAIIEARQEKEITSTFQLRDIIASAKGFRGSRGKKINPATLSFQGLRIFINGELDEIEKVLPIALNKLAPGGLILAISFHSLEDRIVKETFKKWEHPCQCPRSFPICTCGKIPLGKNKTRKPIVANSVEQAANPRSRSAKLRIFKKGSD